MNDWNRNQQPYSEDPRGRDSYFRNPDPRDARDWEPGVQGRRATRGMGREFGEDENSGSPYQGGRSIDPYYSANESSRYGGRSVMDETRGGGEWGRGEARHDFGPADHRDNRERGLQGNHGQTGRHFGFDGSSDRYSGARRGPKGYTRSDERIREDVSDRLAEQHAIDPSDIEVSVRDAEVTLSGTVQSRHEKFRVEEIAASVHGVKDVHNQLRLRRE